MTIKHLVFGGGGSGGYAIYGAIKHLFQNNFLKIEDIQSIYATSIGTLIGIYIALKYDWSVIDDYLIKRPWNKVFHVQPLDIINIWQEKGMLNEEIVKVILKPLLEAKELSEDITLKEFFEYNSIELHVYTTDLNKQLPTKIDISHKTHPNLKLYKAAAMSAAMPILFTPIYDNSCCYIDGGLLNNFPLDDCIKEHNCIAEIFAIRISTNYSIPSIDNTTTLPNYLYNLIEGMRRLITTENKQDIIPNIINCVLEENNFSDWNDALLDKEKRRLLIHIGENYGKEFLLNLQIQDMSNNIVDLSYCIS